MAQSGSFQRDVQDVGVPNTVQRGVVDTSGAELLSTLGGMAIDARSGFEEARLQGQIEAGIDQLEQPFDPVADMTSRAGVSKLFVNLPGTSATLTNPLEMSLDTQTERDVQRDAKSLKQARESGSLTHGEFMARTQALTRSAISRLPGRADTFRKIMSDTLGDHSDRIAPAQELARQRQASLDVANKAQMKLESDALQNGVSVEMMQSINFNTATKAMRNEEKDVQVGEYWANTESILDTTLEGKVRQIQVATGQTLLSPDNMILARQAMQEASEQQKAAISQQGAEKGWDIKRINDLHKKVDAKLKSETDALTELNAADFLEKNTKYREAMVEQGIYLRNPTMAWTMNNSPWMMKEAFQATEAWRRNVGHLDPNNPDHRAEFERKERLWRRDFGFLEATGMFPRDWQMGGFEVSDTINKDAQRLRDLGIPIEMDKAAANTIATHTPEDEQDRSSMHEAIKKLVNSSDGDGMSLIGVTNPNTIANVTADPSAQKILKDSIAGEFSALLRNYELDARVVRDVGETRKLPFGPAYDMKFADAAVKAATPGPKEIFVGKGLGNQPIGLQGVDENYRAGIETIGRTVDAYVGTPIFDGKSGQEWISEKISGLLGPEAQGAPEVGLSLFEKVKRFIFGEPEQAQPAVTSTTQRKQPQTVAKEAAVEEAAVEEIDVENLAGVPDNVREHLVQREGFRSNVYRDSLGKKTVGIGHLIRNSREYELADGTTVKGRSLNVGDELSQQQLDSLFEENAGDAYQVAMEQAREAGISDESFENILTSVIFQMGPKWNKPTKEGGKGFVNTWAAIKRGDFDRAIRGVEKSLWAKQTPVRVKDFVEVLTELKDRPTPQVTDSAEQLEPGVYIINGEIVEIT